MKVFSISTGIGMAKGILVSSRSQRKRPEVNGSDHLNMIFNELIKNVEQMKVKNQKQSDIRNILKYILKYISFMLFTLSYEKNPPS